MKTKKLLVSVLMLVFCLSATQAREFYVTTGGVYGNSGLSWLEPMALKDALGAAQPGDRIFVAAGEYLIEEGEQPYSIGNYAASDIHVYGGFVGNESGSDLYAVPNLDVNQTILKRNSGTGGVVSISGGAGGVIWQGFHITGGNNPNGIQGGGVSMSGTGTLRYCKIYGNTSTSTGFGGGGICISHEAANNLIEYCEIYNNTALNGGGIFTNGPAGTTTILNTVINNNTATASGGGVDLKGDVTIDGCVISNNKCLTTSDYAGGGILMRNNAHLLNSHIYNNTAENGGGGGVMLYGDNPVNNTISNCTIEGNKALSDGGGFLILNWTDGPIITNTIIRNNTAGKSCGGVGTRGNATKMINCLIADNTATQIAGLWGESANSRFINCTIVNNTATGSGTEWSDGGGICLLNANAGLEIKNCIIWGNRNANGPFDINGPVAGFVSNTIYGESAGTVGSLDANGNFSAVPLFVDAVAGNYRLQTGSPAINAGDGTAYIGGYPTEDLFGIDRTFGTIDLGAYEYIPVIVSFSSIETGASLVTPVVASNTVLLGEDFEFTIDLDVSVPATHKIVVKITPDGGSELALEPTTPGGKTFKIEKALTDVDVVITLVDGTGVEQVENDAANVYAVNNALRINVPAESTFAIYSSTGAVCQQGVVSGTAEIALPSGMYIAVVNGKAYKVFVGK